MSTYLSVVIPAYNEEQRLPLTLSRTIEYLKVQPFKSEIIIVSDGSTDGTKNIAKKHLNFFPYLDVIEYSPNKGKGMAVKVGMLKARGELRLFMDADYSVPLTCFTNLEEAIKNGSSIAIGSRAVDGSRITNDQNILRKSLGKLYGVLLRCFTGLSFKDTQCGFKLFRASVADTIFERMLVPHQLFDAEILMLANEMGYEVAEIPVVWDHDGDSRLTYSFFSSLWVLKELWKLRKSR